MASKRQFPNGTWQYRCKCKDVLDKPLYLTFSTEEEGDAYASKAGGFAGARHCSSGT